MTLHSTVLGFLDRLTRLHRLLLIAVVALAVLLAAAPASDAATTVYAGSYTYDAPIATRVGANPIESAEAFSARSSAVREQSALPAYEGRGASTTPIAPSVATEAGGEPVSKATSPIWQSFRPFKGQTKTNGLSGSKKEFYEWDFTHCDIEVYDKNGKHKGTMDPQTGDMIKPAVKGRAIDI